MKRITLLLVLILTAATAYGEVVGMWACDEGEGTTVADKSGYWNNGVFVTDRAPGMLWAEGGPFTYEGNHYLDFNNRAGHVNCGNDESLRVGDGSFTMMAWVNGPDMDNNNCIMGKGALSPETVWQLISEVDLAPGPDPVARIYMRQKDVGTADLVGTITIGGDDQWRHVAGVVNRATNTMSIYVDGVFDVSGPLNGRMVGNDNDLKIGQVYTNNYGMRDYLDEVVLCNTALTQEEIQWYVDNSVHSVPDPVLIPGDATRNGTVDEDDAEILAAHWLGSGGWTEGNFNGDDIIDDIDATMMATNWQKTPGGAVPEPCSTVMLLALAAVGAFVFALQRGKQKH